MVLNNVEWTPENIKKAEKACKESQQTVLIKTIDVRVTGDTTLHGWGDGIGQDKEWWKQMAIIGIGEGTQKKQKGKLLLLCIVDMVGASQLAHRTGMIKFQGKEKKKEFF